MSGRAEKEHGKARVMNDSFFRFCVETFLEATSLVVPRSGFAPGYRRPHQAKDLAGATDRGVVQT